MGGGEPLRVADLQKSNDEFGAAVAEAREFLRHYERSAHARHVQEAYRSIFRAQAMLLAWTPSASMAALFERTRRNVLATMQTHVSATLEALEANEALRSKTVAPEVGLVRDARIVARMQAEYSRIRLEQAAWLADSTRPMPRSIVQSAVHERIARAVGTSRSTVLRAWTDFLGLAGPAERLESKRTIATVEKNAREIAARLEAKGTAAPTKRPSKKRRLDFSRSGGP